MSSISNISPQTLQNSESTFFSSYARNLRNSSRRTNPSSGQAMLITSRTSWLTIFLKIRRSRRSSSWSIRMMSYSLTPFLSAAIFYKQRWWASLSINYICKLTLIWGETSSGSTSELEIREQIASILSESWTLRSRVWLPLATKITTKIMLIREI
jgi:hypothetical protein